MRYRGGGIGHKSIREATLCLFDDRDALDKQEFNLEHDRNLFDEEAEGTNDDVPMDDSSSSDEESGDESESEESAMEDINPAHNAPTLSRTTQTAEGEIRPCMTGRLTHSPDSAGYRCTRHS